MSTRRRSNRDLLLGASNNRPQQRRRQQTRSSSSNSGATITESTASNRIRTRQVPRGHVSVNTPRSRNNPRSNAQSARTRAPETSNSSATRVLATRSPTIDQHSPAQSSRAPCRVVEFPPETGELSKCIRCQTGIEENNSIDLTCSHKLCTECLEEYKTKRSDELLYVQCPVCVPTKLLESLKEELTCTLCLSTLERPVLFDCGHMNCAECWDMAKMQPEWSECCPLCQRRIEKIIEPNYTINNVIEKVLTYEKTLVGPF